MRNINDKGAAIVTATSCGNTTVPSLRQGKSTEFGRRSMRKTSLVIATLVISCLTIFFSSELRAEPNAKGNCIHVLNFEKTLGLYREILGFKMLNAEVLKDQGHEGVLIMKMQAGESEVCLSLPTPESLNTVKPNNNAIQVTLSVTDLAALGDKLEAEGYKLQSKENADVKSAFFTGPNGETINLAETK